MDRAAIEPAIKIVLTEIHSKLNESRAHRKSRRGLCTGGERRRRRDRFDGYRTTGLRGRSSTRRRLAVNRLSRE
jgi:hypothetical protein